MSIPPSRRAMPMKMMRKQHTLVLRGYFKQADERRFLGVCLTLNLVVEGPTLEQAKAKLESLIRAYLADAIENNEFHAFVPRRAPLSFYAEYWLGRVETWLHSIRKPFYSFSEARLV